MNIKKTTTILLSILVSIYFLKTFFSNEKTTDDVSIQIEPVDKKMNAKKLVVNNSKKKSMNSENRLNGPISKDSPKKKIENILSSLTSDGNDEVDISILAKNMKLFKKIIKQKLSNIEVPLPYKLTLIELYNQLESEPSPKISFLKDIITEHTPRPIEITESTTHDEVLDDRFSFQGDMHLSLLSYEKILGTELNDENYIFNTTRELILDIEHPSVRSQIYLAFSNQYPELKESLAKEVNESGVVILSQDNLNENKNSYPEGYIPPKDTELNTPISEEKLQEMMKTGESQ